MSADGTERELEVAGKIMQQALELIGRVAGVGPRPAEPGTEPAEGRADEACGDQLPPAPDGAFGDRLLALSRRGGPLQRRTEAVAEPVDDGPEHGADGGATPPEISGQDRDRRALAESDPADGQMLEDLAGS
jgi:hypothetical protein